MPELRVLGGKLVYDEHGAGEPPVVFVHGFSCSVSDWRHQIDALSGEVRCIAVDQTGHGRSGPSARALSMENLAADVAELLDHLDLSQAVLVGHSMGTRVVIQAALDARARVGGIVLVDGSSVPADPELIRKTVSEAIAEKGYEAWSDNLMTSLLIDTASREDQEMIVSRARRLDPRNAIDMFAGMMSWDLNEFPLRHKELRCPVAVLQSTSVIKGEGWERKLIDEAPDSLWLDAWRERPNACIETYPATGHFPMLERPAAVSQAIRELIKRI
ncbi:MAG: alpha/beta hydrolase [Pseudomonadota bacterium]